MSDGRERYGNARDLRPLRFENAQTLAVPGEAGTHPPVLPADFADEGVEFAFGRGVQYLRKITDPTLGLRQMRLCPNGTYEGEHQHQNAIHDTISNVYDQWLSA